MEIALLILIALLAAVCLPQCYFPLESLPRGLTQMLTHYQKTGKGSVALNETTERTMGLTGLILRKAQSADDSGPSVSEKLQFSTSELANWVPIGQKIDLGGTKPPTWVTFPRRFAHLGHFLSYQEIDYQGKDDQTVLNDIATQADEDAALSMIRLLHEAFNAADGNYRHDGSENFLRMFGWRYFITIDGLHIAGTSTAIGGTNPSTQTLWQNPYINPVAASDGRATAGNVGQWRQMVNRLLRMLSYRGVNEWGKFAGSVKGVPDEDFHSNNAKVGDTLIGMCDTGTFDDVAELFFDRRDDVGKDQTFVTPMYKGIPFMENERMGINATYGYGFDSNGNALWTDRGSSYASGNWKGTGETAILNVKHLKFRVHSQHWPKIYPAYKPEGMLGVAHERDAWPQLTCDSRRRVGGLISGYQLFNNA